MDIFNKWQNRNNPETNRIPALIIGGLIFPISIPLFLIFLPPQLDNILGFDPFYNGWGNIIAGVLFIIIGGVVAVWTIIIQIQLASGTPFPMLPTKNLLVVGPFKYCRNPMTLGTILAYAGIAVWIGSLSAVIAVAIMAAILIGYVKLIEEKELLLRFGTEYMEYKKKTPFIIPKSKRK
jgi:protein-S-isoprenylcysteine O-methyltransferase Ste14